VKSWTRIGDGKRSSVRREAGVVMASNQARGIKSV